jgi:DNA-binding IclR family transcriptional regulator
MSAARTRDQSGVQSAAQVLDVLDLLFRADYTHGASPGEISRELGITPASMTRYIATLLDRGAIEAIPSGHITRYRPSVRWGRYAAGILRSLDDSARRIDELKTRITTPLD